MNRIENSPIINDILTVLNELQIKTYAITEVMKDSIELYFVKKSLDMRRCNKVDEVSIVVYRDFEKDGKKMRGSASSTLSVTMNHEELTAAIQSAYYAASFVCNPYYDLPTGSKKDLVSIQSKLLSQPLEENALLLSEALYACDTASDVWINSSEFFASKSTTRIVTSEGIDVCYEKANIKGEFVTQCKTPQDVETYQDFSYEELELDTMTELAKETLSRTKARALATTAPKTGTYNVILNNEQVATMLNYYLAHSYSSYVYAGYSNYSVGCHVQGDADHKELLNIELKAVNPYSKEGIPMINRPLITNGVLNTIQGDSRFANYLKIPATGLYHSIKVNNGSMSLSEMKSEPYLQILNFSDFQMDDFTGDFGGEIRLAFLYDGKEVKEVTGGSISGNISNYHNKLVFSTEQQVLSNYEGPKALYLKDVTVSGC